MKRKGIVLLVALTLVFTAAFAAACWGEDSSDDKEYVVSFYDGTTKLFEVTVDEGEKITPAADGKIGSNPLPTKAGKKFDGWFDSAELEAPFDFTAAVEANKSVYAGFVDAYTVSFYDGETKLFEVLVEPGEKITPASDGKIGDNPLPTQTGKTFVDWYRSPAFLVPFDFTAAINGNASVYAAFRSAYQEDTRDWGIAGTGKGAVLYTSDFGRNYSDMHKMTKLNKSGVNEFEITLDIFEGDYFQITLGGSYTAGQRGWAYISGSAGENFSELPNALNPGGYQNDIVCEVDGNYTLTLTTYPADDTVGTNNPNVNLFDKIVAVRNGDTVEDPVSATLDYFIKGNKISGWNNMIDTFHQFGVVEFGKKYSKTIYLDAAEDFMILSRTINVETGAVGYGSQDINSTALDEASLDFVEVSYNNVRTKAAGNYTITIDLEKAAAERLNVTYDETGTRQLEDYYLNGTIGGASWDMMAESNGTFKPAAKMQKVGNTDNYTITLEGLAEGEEFTVNGFKAGVTETGANESNRTGSYNHAYVMASKYFSPVSADNLNIKVTQDGDYVVTINAWSKQITIVPKDAPVDVYLVGSFTTGWAFNWEDNVMLKPSQADASVLEIIFTFEVATEFTLRYFANGIIFGNGSTLKYDGEAFLNKADMTDEFVGSNGTAGNIKVQVAGTYKISYYTTGENAGKFEIIVAQS